MSQPGNKLSQSKCAATGKSHRVFPLVAMGKGGIFRALLSQPLLGRGHGFSRSRPRQGGWQHRDDFVQAPRLLLRPGTAEETLGSPGGMGDPGGARGTAGLPVPAESFPGLRGSPSSSLGTSLRALQSRFWGGCGTASSN